VPTFYYQPGASKESPACMGAKAIEKVTAQAASRKKYKLLYFV
jgi:hypothetical protein